MTYEAAETRKRWHRESGNETRLETLMAEDVQGGARPGAKGSPLPQKGGEMEQGVALSWLEETLEIIVGSLLRVLIPLVLVSLFALMILSWIVEDVWRWLRSLVQPSRAAADSQPAGAIQSEALGQRPEGTKRFVSADVIASRGWSSQEPPHLYGPTEQKEGGRAEAGLQSRDLESRGFNSHAGHNLGMRMLEKVMVYGGLVGLVLLFFFTLHMQRSIMDHGPKPQVVIPQP